MSKRGNRLAGIGRIRAAEAQRIFLQISFLSRFYDLLIFSAFKINLFYYTLYSLVGIMDFEQAFAASLNRELESDSFEYERRW